jgi:L-arabinokinase
VELVHKAQMGNGTENLLFGAKITGGGCGGTVCVLGKNSVETAEQIYKVQKNLGFRISIPFFIYIFCCDGKN